MHRRLPLFVTAFLLALAGPALADESADAMQKPRQVDDNAQYQRVYDIVRSTYPMIFSGTPQSGTYCVALVVRADGTVARSGIRLVEGDARGSEDMPPELARVVPTDIGRNSYTVLRRHDPRLKNNNQALILLGTLPADYDEMRSDVRVIEAVYAKHSDLLRLPSSGQLSRVTVLMNERGGIEREKIEPIDPNDTLPPVTPSRFMALFNLHLDQVGVIGQTRIFGTPVGEIGPTREQPMLYVDYAWPRRKRDPISSVHPVYLPGRITKLIDLDIAQRYFPEQFSITDPDAAQPWVLLSAGGDILATGKAAIRYSALLQAYLEQKYPGIRTDNYFGETVTNAEGKWSLVQYVWLGRDSPLPPEPAPAAPTGNAAPGSKVAPAGKAASVGRTAMSGKSAPVPMFFHEVSVEGPATSFARGVEVAPASNRCLPTVLANGRNSVQATCAVTGATGSFTVAAGGAYRWRVQLAPADRGNVILTVLTQEGAATAPWRRAAEVRRFPLSHVGTLNWKDGAGHAWQMMLSVSPLQ